MKKWKLWLATWRAKRAIALVARSYCPTAKAFKWRVRPMGPPSFCIEIPTDQQRDRILQDPNLFRKFCDAACDAGFPREITQRIRFRVESRETLDRDYGGSWWEAVEMP
jgi:hypothetical protein